MPLKFAKIGICLLAAAQAIGCSSRQPVQLSADPPPRINFSGDWEINYQLSERIQENVDTLRLMAIKEARRRGDTWLTMPSLELVRLAESISRAPVLEIDQLGDQIEIRRKDDFPLTCHFGEVPQPDVDPLASEICGWDLHQLVFAFRLPDGLRVTHRLTLGPDRDRLNLATTVRTRGAGQEFTLNRVYTRFESPEEPYECRYTLDRGKTCWAGARDRQATSLE